MVEETKKINLDGKFQQLLDLNKDIKNFKAEFTITPHLLEFEIPYQVAVVTQEKLDTDDNIEFKEMKGAFTGTVKNEDGDGQNYFLAIKSEKPMKGMIFKVIRTELQPPVVQEQLPPPPPAQPSPPPSHRYLPEMPMPQQSLNQSSPSSPQSSGSSMKYFRYIIALFVLIGGVFLLYYFYKQNLQKKKLPSLYD